MKVDPAKAAADATVAAAAGLTRSISESSSVIENMILVECNIAADLSVQTKYQQNHSINTTFERMTHERDHKVAGLSNDLATCNMRLQELHMHRERMLEQLQHCEQEIANLSNRISGYNTELNNSTIYYQQQLEALAHSGKQVSIQNLLDLKFF